MVRKTLLNRGRFLMRKAFTMIELIFAIVILAVVMLTIPMMIGVNNKALEGNAAQEAIFLVSAVLSETTTLLWDDNSLEGNATSVSMGKILDIGAPGTTYGREDVNSSIRQGGLNEDLHRSFFSASQAPALAAGDSVILAHDISNSVADSAGYKSNFTIVAQRYYVSDTGTPFAFTVPMAAGQTNIKMTQVEINATVDGTNLVIARLRAYTCNIGEIDFAKRRF